jgi:hypothetical protein
MLEVIVSVWPNTLPVDTPLSTSEGRLVLVSIDVEAHALETLLDALAALDFPINPQIYHDAALVYRFADGREDRKPITLVEFPAYEDRLGEVRRSLESRGFDPARVHAVGILEAMRETSQREAAPEGAAYVSRQRVKRRAAVA